MSTRTSTLRRIGGAAIVAGLAFAAPQVMAGAALLNSAGDLAMGINPEGHHNVYSPTTADSIAINVVNTGGALGIAYSGIDGNFRDATAPGCLCEGWGVSATGSAVGTHSAHATVDNNWPGVQNLTVDSFVHTPTSITSAVHLNTLPGLTVEHYYTEAAETDRLFQARVTISNTTGDTLNDVRYVRAMDWDVPLTEFNEYVTIAGTASTTDLEFSNDNGFCSVNPLDPCTALAAGTTNVDFIDSGPTDHGAYFKFNFGSLAAGESKIFDIFYGAAANELEALLALGQVEAELFSLGQSSGDPTFGTPATFMFAFRGVGGDVLIPTPEPGTLGMLGLAMLGFAGARRRRG